MASSSLSSCSISIPGNRISLPSSSSSTKSQCSLLFNLRTLAYPIASVSRTTLASTPIASSSSFSSSLRYNGRRARVSASVPDSVDQPGEGMLNKLDNVQRIENEADLKLLPNVDELIKAYKEAVLSRDNKAASDNEAKLNIIENQKNVLVYKLQSMQYEITSAKERYIRLQADFDNFRKRSDKEKLALISDAKGEVIENLLAMVDSFERARLQIKTETQKEEKIGKSYLGIYKQFVEIMRSLNVSVIPTVGKPFNSSIHEAVAREECKEFKAGIVIQEIRRGFLLGNKLLRTAIVKISSGPVKEVQSDTEGFEQAAATQIDGFPEKEC